MPREDVLREVDGWINKAESDLRNIELVMPADDAPYDTVCFHAQQAAEKYIKALLTFHGTQFRKTHDLSELLTLLPPSSTLPAELGDLSELTDAAVTVRYPDFSAEYDRALAGDLVGKAMSVKDAVLSALARLGHVPES